VTRLSKILISRIIRKAKDLSDEEILALYHKVKENLDAQTKTEDQVLDGERHGPTPMEEQDTSFIPPVQETLPSDGNTENSDKDIDDLLSSLGLGDTSEDEKTAALPLSTPPPVSPIAPTSKPPRPVTPPVADFSQVPVVNQPINAPASKPIGINQVEVEKVNEPSLLPEEGSHTEEPPIDPSILPEDKKEKNADEDLFERITDKIVSDPRYDIKNFKTSSRGFQLKRKDQDLMADGIVKSKYETPDIKPPRTDVRDPFGERYKKNEKNRDKDIDSDPDLK